MYICCIGIRETFLQLFLFKSKTNNKAIKNYKKKIYYFMNCPSKYM